jgi:rSAM/selenodomain-associated transferase 2
VLPTVSVIVPVFDEARRIRVVLDALLREHGCEEVIVVDGGSRDGTAEIAIAHGGAHVTRAPRGRASQMNAGARVARGDVLLFLHADTDLPPGALRSVAAAVAGGADFGCFRVRIDSSDLRLRLASHLISLRSSLIVSGTGDQALFFRRSFFESLGGFDDLPLFEDMRIVGRARGRGRWVCLGPPVRTSARRWEANGVTRTMALMLGLRALYHLGVDPRRLAALYRSNPRAEHDHGDTKESRHEAPVAARPPAGTGG